ncbi:MAG TPA: MATE family efflux transporter [Clostridiales bacterium]|nr:MATE family efflux transporter [Clostridiales bacterium]
MERSITKDMTKGSPAKLILRFSVPMLIGNVFQQFYNLVDSVVVGKFVGSEALAAVGATGSLVFLIIGLSFGLSTGVSIVIGQYFGAKDYANVRKAFATATYLVLGVSIVLGVVGFFSSRWLLELLNTPDTIIDQSDFYMKITFAGILGVTCYNGMAAVLRAFGDSITPLIFLALACVLNIVLDLLFVLQFHWDVPGVAFATVLSQIIAAACCTVYAMIKVKILRMPWKEFRMDREILRKCIRLGIPVALQNALVSSSMMALQGVINSYNDVVIAANTVYSRIEQLVLQPGMSVGAALAAYTGQNVGAGKLDRVKKGFEAASIIIILFSIVMLPVMYFGGEHVMTLFINKEEMEVLTIGGNAIRITCFFYIALGMILVTRNFLSGAGDINVPLIMGFTEVVCRILFAVVLTRLIGFYGIWWATALNWCATCIVGVIRVYSGKWKTKTIIHA